MGIRSPLLFYRRLSPGQRKIVSHIRILQEKKAEPREAGCLYSVSSREGVFAETHPLICVARYIERDLSKNTMRVCYLCIIVEWSPRHRPSPEQPVVF
jgi:hypothetical protein